MSDLGQFLKEARERKQLSLEDLQRITKIQKRYLNAIEEGRFETLPGLFYARAFVKTYAETVDLDPEQLFEEFKNELPNPQREAVVLPSRSERTKQQQPPTNRPKRSSFLPALAGVIVLIIVVFSIWKLAQVGGGGDRANEPVSPNESENNIEAKLGEIGSEPTAETEEPEATNEPETDDDEGQADEPTDEEPQMTLTFNKSEGNTSYFQLENGRLDDVRVTLAGPSYIDVKNGLGKTFYTGQPSEGEVVFEDLADEEQVIFNFGASQNVKLFISGQEVEFPLQSVHQKIAVIVGSGQ